MNQHKNWRISDKSRHHKKGEISERTSQCRLRWLEKVEDFLSGQSVRGNFIKMIFQKNLNHLNMAWQVAVHLLLQHYPKVTCHLSGRKVLKMVLITLIVEGQLHQGIDQSEHSVADCWPIRSMEIVLWCRPMYNSTKMVSYIRIITKNTLARVYLTPF